jgi:hypothetical protein
MKESRRVRAPHGPGRSPAKEQFWRRHVGRQQRSRRTIRDYCAKAGISEPSFYAWRSELARRDLETDRPVASKPSVACRTPAPAPRFLPVTVAEYPRAGAMASQVEVALPGGLVVRVPAHDTAALRTVLELLGPKSC